MQSKRDYSWDFMRAFYLLLGIPFHAAVVYSTHFDWSVASPDRSPTLTVIADFIHTFRMPGFFVIAGYFSIMILLRENARSWLTKRLVRLGVPLLVASLTILPFQILIQTRAEMLGSSFVLDDYLQAVVFRLTHFDEPWVSHLWFLYSLIAFSAGLAVVAMVLGNARFKRMATSAVEFFFDRKWLAFVCVALVAAALALVLPEIYARFGTKLRAVAGYLQYFPYFALGLAIYLSPRVQNRYVRFGLPGLALGIVLAANSMLEAQTPWSSAVLMISGLFGALMITGFIAKMARHYFNKPNAGIAKVVDASFTIYLFHHPIIFVLAMIFTQVDLPPIVEFGVMVPVTALVTYQIHKLIAANWLTAFLFNGMMPKPAIAVGSARSVRVG